MSMKNKEEPFIESYFLFMLAAAHRNISLEFHDRLRLQSIRVADWRVLSCLVNRSNLMITELAAETLYEQPHVTKIIDRLEAKKLVKRDFDVGDKRRSLVHITNKGVKLVDPLIVQARIHEQEVLSQLSKEEQSHIFSILKKLM